MKAIDWINHLNMSCHPEGGYYKEIFRSEKLVDNDKSAMTSLSSTYKCNFLGADNKQ